MDFAELKSQVLALRALLQQRGIHFDGAILFGSRAKGTHRIDSDVDLAIISRDFGKNHSAERILLNRLAFKCIPYCDAIPVGVTDYLDPYPLSPILHEIKSHGTPLF